MKEGLKLVGRLRIKKVSPDGKVEIREARNIIVNTGFDLVCDAISNPARGPEIDNLAVGSSTVAPSVTDTALGNEIARKVATYSHTPGTKVYTLEATFGAGEAVGTLAESGLFDQTAAGNMFCRTTFPIISKAEADVITFTWEITLS